MLIRNQIRRLVRSHELYCLESTMFGDETPRALFVTDDVRRAVNLPFPAGYEVLHGEFRQSLDAFLEGSDVSVGERPKTKDSDAMMARVCPVEDEFFDFRINAPYPKIRAFGGFSEKDTFVVLTWQYRDIIAGDFDGEVARCKMEWQKLFARTPPFKGKTLGDYLSQPFTPV